jgi:hypothetical protein
MAPGTLENFYTDNGMLFNNDAYFTDIAIDGCEVDGDAVEQPDPLNSCGNFCGALLHFGPGTVTADCHRISIRNNYWHGYAGVPGNLGGAIGLLCATGTALEFSHNQISAADGHGGGFLSTAPGTLIAYNTLLGTGWGDCGLTLNNTTSDGGIVSSNVLNGHPICIEGSSNFLVTDNIISNITANYAINIGNLAGEHGIVARNIITNNPASTNCIGVTVSGIQTLDILDNVCTLVSGGFANPGGMPNVTSADWNVRAKGVKTGTFSVFMGCSGAVAAGATVWLGMSTASPCSTVAFSGATQMPSTPYAYTYMRHLRVEIGAAAVHDIVATLYVNGGPNPLTCTILTGQLNCADLVNLAPVPALGGRLAIGVATQAGETATDVFASWEM